jgi:gas vesicle protein
MNEKDCNGLKSFSIGLGCGLAVGVIVGILFAPQEGKKTRQLIREKAVEAEKKVKDSIEKVKSKFPLVKNTDKVHNT